jgi:hypothetical protein
MTPHDALPPGLSLFVPRPSTIRVPGSAQSAPTPRESAYGSRYPAPSRTVASPPAPASALRASVAALTAARAPQVTPAGPMRRVLGRKGFHIITPGAQPHSGASSSSLRRYATDPHRSLGTPRRSQPRAPSPRAPQPPRPTPLPPRPPRPTTIDGAASAARRTSPGRSTPPRSARRARGRCRACATSPATSTSSPHPPPPPRPRCCSSRCQPARDRRACPARRRARAATNPRARSRAARPRPPLRPLAAPPLRRPA